MLTLKVTLANGETYAVVPENPEYVRWDRYAMRNKIASAQSVPFLWQTYLAWAHLNRRRIVTDAFDRFADELCVHCEAEVDDDETADPTQPGARPGSS